MEQGISEIFGEGVGEGGRKVKIYRALRGLICSACAGSIEEGSLFTREGLRGFGLRIMPRCRECAPFELRSEKRGAKSQLIENLLTSDSEKQDVAEKPTRQPRAEVERRLGPALSRARSKRR